jgi:hypothetical protein
MSETRERGKIRLETAEGEVRTDVRLGEDVFE